MTCRSGSATQTVAAIGSSGSFAQWGTRPGAPSCGAWRPSRASRSLTGMRSSAPWAAPRRGWYATTTTASQTRFAPASRRRAVLVRVAPAPRAKRLVGKIRAEDGQHEDAIDELLPDVEAAFTGPSFWAPFLKRAHTAGIPRLSDWLDTTGRIVEDQFDPARTALEAVRGHTADHLAAGRVHQPGPRVDPAARVRAEEPRPHQPEADARAAARQPPGRRARLRPADPRDPRGQPGPTQQSRAARSSMPAAARCADIHEVTLTRVHSRPQSGPENALGGPRLSSSRSAGQLATSTESPVAQAGSCIDRDYPPVPSGSSPTGRQRPAGPQASASGSGMALGPRGGKSCFAQCGSERSRAA